MSNTEAALRELVDALTEARALWYDAWEWERPGHDRALEAARTADRRVEVARERLRASSERRSPDGGQTA